MATKLSEIEVVNLIQRGLKDDQYAGAYFNREQIYKYYIFDDVEAIITLLKQNMASDLYITCHSSNAIEFSSDEWIIFANGEIANELLAILKPLFNESDASDSE